MRKKLHAYYCNTKPSCSTKSAAMNSTSTFIKIIQLIKFLCKIKKFQKKNFCAPPRKIPGYATEASYRNRHNKKGQQIPQRGKFDTFWGI